jgi:histidyl-tRNA synthetase
LSRIEPRTLKGFRDYLPAAMIAREELIDAARRVYRSYGFAPIDTPALEYLDVLLGKGSEETDKQLYRFKDHGGRDVGMRFDLTVPLARFMAQHHAELGTPFKRYHIGTVWRGENTQRGRYREFMQCDFDTIGTLSVAADIETALVIHDLMLAIGFDAFQIRVNNRMVLNGVLERLGVAEKSAAVLRALDKLGKVDRNAVAAEMVATAEVSPEQGEEIVRLSELTGSSAEILQQLEPLVAGSAKGTEGVARLRDIFAAVEAAGVPAARLRLDVSIARGLDYYTGTIYETFLDALPGIGSVCSGGRYDNLAELYTSQQLPGIGASLGLDRLLAAMEELGMVAPATTPAEVFMAYFDASRLPEYLRLASQLRAVGLRVEFFPESKKLGAQLKYADRRGFRVAIIAGETEFAANQVQVKNLATGESQSVSLDRGVSEVVRLIREGERRGETTE